MCRCGRVLNSEEPCTTLCTRSHPTVAEMNCVRSGAFGTGLQPNPLRAVLLVYTIHPQPQALICVFRQKSIKSRARKFGRKTTFASRTAACRQSLANSGIARTAAAKHLNHTHTHADLVMAHVRQFVARWNRLRPPTVIPGITSQPGAGPRTVVHRANLLLLFCASAHGGRGFRFHSHHQSYRTPSVPPGCASPGHSSP